MSYGNVLTRDFDKKYRTLGNVLTVGFLYELMIFQAIYLFVYLAKGNFYSISKIATIFMIWFGIGSLFMGFRDFKKVVADTQVVKQAGNSIVVDVMKALYLQMDISKYGV